jgi:hypothetical protein
VPELLNDATQETAPSGVAVTGLKKAGLSPGAWYLTTASSVRPSPRAHALTFPLKALALLGQPAGSTSSAPDQGQPCPQREGKPPKRGTTKLQAA